MPTRPSSLITVPIQPLHKKALIPILMPYCRINQKMQSFQALNLLGNPDWPGLIGLKRHGRSSYLRTRFSSNVIQKTDMYGTVFVLRKVRVKNENTLSPFVRPTIITEIEDMKLSWRSAHPLRSKWNPAHFPSPMRRSISASPPLCMLWLPRDADLSGWCQKTRNPGSSIYRPYCTPRVFGNCW